MPILIFIVQRLVLLLLAIMTFLGITSDETYISTSNSYQVEKERKVAITELLEKDAPLIIAEDRNETLVEKVGLSDILEKINNEIPVFGQKEIIENTTTEKEEEKPVFDTEIQKETNNIIEDIEKELEKIREEANKIALTESDPVEEPEIEIITNNFNIANTPNNAVINIVCLERINDSLSIITGSGIIISPTGSVLTNGHVAQHLLDQEDKNIDCEIKHPNNPSMNYRAVISYIPSIWKGGGMFNLKYGTGENDYAFLSIVGPGPLGTIPDSFPYISPNTSSKNIEVGNDIYMLGYPSKKSGIYKVDTNLPLITDISVITDVFTFNKTSKDIFSSGVSPVAKQGSSGGAVVDDGKLIGLIATTNEHSSGGSILNAISLSYIKDNLEENGLSIDTFLK